MSKENDNNSLERRIKQFYKRQKLPADVLVELKAIAEPKPKAVATPPPRTFFKPVFTYAAFAAVILTIFSFSLFGFQRYSRAQHIESVAAEIALNHAKRFDTEFTSTSIANLSSEMDLLDFLPVHPQRMRHDNFDMVGARYCTIDSAIAVQIHLEAGDEAYTLYEFREPDSFLSNREKVIEIDNIEVTLWQEGEVVMGLAKNINRSIRE